MVQSSFSLSAFLAVAFCLIPIIHSLSIPPPPTKQVIRADDDSPEDLTTTLAPNGSGEIDDLLVIETTDPSGTKDDDGNLNGSLSGKNKPVMEVVDVIFRPFRPPSVLVLDFFRKSNSSNNAGNNSEEDDNIDSSEASSKTNNGASGGGSKHSGSTEADSRENHGGIMSSISGDSDGRDNNDVSASRAQGANGSSPRKPVIGITVKNGPTSQMTSSSVAAQKQFSMDNEDIDDARRTSDKQNNADDGNDDGDSFTIPVPTNVASRPSSPSKKNDHSGSSGDGNNNQRRKRETHQMGNISKEDHDDSSSSKNLTGKFQPDDMTKSNNGDNVSSNGADSDSSSPNDAPVDDSNDMDDNGQRKTTDGKKESGAVKIFLEILQLVPLSTSNSSTTTTTTSISNSDEDSSSADATTTTTTTTAATTTTTSADDKEDTGTKTVVQSMKANSNQKFSSANSLAVNSTASEQSQAGVEETQKVMVSRKRVARSAPTKEESEKKGNPSTSRTTSASPSSTTTSKPLTGKNAPAAPSPSTNAPAKKPSSTSPADDSEGPPLENVTEPVGKSDDD